jgi:HD superfamily phosphodiesterase
MYETLKAQAWELLGQNADQHKNGIMHLDGVAMLCALIGLKRGLNLEICRCAGLLHDLWLYCNFPLQKGMHERHGHFGSDLARELLIKNGGYSEDKIKIICTMIYNHNDKGIVHDEYSETLKDADALQHYLNDSDYDRRYRYFGRDSKILDEFMIAKV